jgi:hypothetical protein
MSVVSMVTATGENHGLINRIGNSVAHDDFKHMSPKTKEHVKKEKAEDSKIVKARYINQRSRNERLDKPYCRYAGDPICLYHLIPGHVYDLPMGFIKEVNEKRTVKRSGLVSVDGVALKKDESPIEKDQFEDSHHQLVPITF